MTQANILHVLAPAKINLSLAITGKRDDGYHLLDSFVTFADWGDELVVLLNENTPQIILLVTGDFADQCGDVEENLAYRAALLMREKFSRDYNTSQGCSIKIEKNIPVGAGLGGGSSDAAAVMKALNRLWNINASIEELASIGVQLGADVPACLYAKPLRMQGIGNEITLLLAHPPLHALLLNPQKHLSTGRVYQSLHIITHNADIPELQYTNDIDSFLSMLATSPQDMESAAISLMPAIADILAILKHQDGCAVSRLCGSGATCMGLFKTKEKRDAASKALQKEHPEYWNKEIEITDLSNALNH